MRRVASRSLECIRPALRQIGSGKCTQLPAALAPCATASAALISGTTQCGGIQVRTMTQQVRKYAPTAGQTPQSSSTVPCWNCEQQCGRKEHMLCAACGHLQDVDMEINYFELLNFPKSFALQQQELTRRYRQLQTLVHPDKYSNKTTREQSNSADWSALINRAYKTLLAPLERGQYMLQLRGMQMPQDNSVLDKQFLMEMMERNEEVDEACTSEALQALNENIVKELDASANELRAQFDADALEPAKLLLVKMKYLASIQKSIKNKMQRLMGG